MKVYEELEIAVMQFGTVDIICASDNFTEGWEDPNEENVIGKF